MTPAVAQNSPISNPKPKKQLPKNINNIEQIKINWIRVLTLTILNISTIYGLFLLITQQEYFLWIFGFALGLCGYIGVTAGAHRLWAHCSYKAKWQLRSFLMIVHHFASLNNIHYWVRDHRTHHKFIDTNSDPYNSKRGFLFTHMNWSMFEKHSEVKNNGINIDMSDIEADKIVMFQKTYFVILMPLISFILPTIIPWHFYGYSIQNTFIICCMVRFNIALHLAWSINSLKRFIHFIPNSKIYFNYHHIFPWDYKTPEFGSKNFNITTIFIEQCANLGFAYDLKTASDESIRERLLEHSNIYVEVLENPENKFDLLKELNLQNEQILLWGWGDEDMPDNDKKNARIITSSSNKSTILNLSNITNMCFAQLNE